MDTQQKQQVVEQLASANNVLVTVTSSPTLDELSAAIGLTIVLNHLNKHATTVFSGVVPSALEFLQPEKTIETTTDSLRDFIIALDKSKADKLRYKVEDDVVRIFITPYRTSITDKDLNFSQGDFNVDAVVALGVTKKEDLDKAITAHGRIMHDASVITVTKQDINSELGNINWHGQVASSICEMIASIVNDLGNDLLDGQAATALLTGIVSETDRFKNEKTQPFTLSISSQLMASGANQQLIAEELEAPEPAPQVLNSASQDANTSQVNDDGSLEISHDDEELDELKNINIDEHGNLDTDNSEESTVPDELPLADKVQEPEASQEVAQPQEGSEGTSLTHESSLPTPYNPDSDEDKPTLPTAQIEGPMMQHQKIIEPLKADGDSTQSDNSENNLSQPLPIVPPAMPPSHQTLADLEKAIDSPHLSVDSNNSDVEEHLGSLREAVSQATEAQEPQNPTPRQSIGAQTVDLNKSAPELPQQQPQVVDKTAPPPVPPPMTPQFFDADGKTANPFLNPPAK